MNSPPELVKVIEQARTAVRDDVEHALKPYLRRQIYDAFALGSKAREVRARLEIMTARKTLPFWQEVWPENKLPHDLLQCATEVLEGVSRAELVTPKVSAAWLELEEIGAQSLGEVESQAFFAGQAALEAALHAIGEDRWKGIELSKEDEDADLDPWSSDTASWAAAAWAGPFWEGKSDANRRREFWLWWLSEAIPRAWQKTHTSPND